MRVCFVLPSLRPSGGVAVASRHARRLAADHSMEAELIVCEPGGEAPAGVPVRMVGDAAGRPYDVAISTWWETASVLWQLEASRRVALLQSFEQRFYGPEAPFERLFAEATLTLPLDFIVVASWMRDLLAELRPDARCWVVPPGIDKELFGRDAGTRRQGPLEVLIDGQPSLPFKGVREAVAAVQAMREPVHSTLVALDAEAAGDLQVDRVVGGLDAAGMAALYRESDVLVKLSRVESLGLAPVEAFHSGLPCLLTPYTGHEEYARPGENAVVVGFDDVSGTAEWLDRLARDRALLAELSAGARATAAAWPSEAESTRLLHDALLELLESEPPAADERFLLRTLALSTELGRGRMAALEATEAALHTAQAHVRELSASRDECSDMLEDARAELTRIRSSPAYRLGSAAKRAGRALRIGG